MADLDAIFKAYDIRGITPDQLDAPAARAIGAAFARFVSSQQGGAKRVLVARDMRDSGAALVAAFPEGGQAQGIDNADLGMAHPDLLSLSAGKPDRSEETPGGKAESMERKSRV